MSKIAVAGRKLALLLFIVCLFASAPFFLKPFTGIAEDEEEQFSGADRQLASWFQARAYPDPENLNQKYAAAWEQFQQFRNNRAVSGPLPVATASWTGIGPDVSIGGRILCVTIDPSNSNNLWAGSASGGIWKSVNAGASWTPVVTGFPVLGVSSILVHPTNPSIIYAGTGEVYRVDTSNIGFNVWKARGTYGVGILKSTDGGLTWSPVLAKNSSDMFAIQMLEFDPVDPNIVFACATDGLYKTVNGGTDWTRILAKTYVSDIAINPSNRDQIVVGVGNMINTDKGIYRTTNGTAAAPTWTKITSGLPTSFRGFIRLDNVGATRLVASIGRDDNSTQGEIYISTNFGSTWVNKSGSHHCQYQFWFSHDVAINPSNLNQLVMGGVPLYRYTYTSTTTTSGTRTTIGSNVHSDIHDVEFDPRNNSIIYVATDGGVYKSINGGSSFAAINTGLSATQFYASIGVHPTDPNIIIGGLQDNGVVRYNGSSWATVFGGDGGPSTIAPNGTTVFASNDARKVSRSTTGVTGSFTNVLSSYAFSADDRTAFMAPIAVSKSNPSFVYAASDNIHRSTDGGATWTNNSYTTATSYIEKKNKTGIAIAVSPVNPTKIYVSTSPFAQNTTNENLWVNPPPNVFKSTSPATVPYTSIKSNLPDRFVMDFAISATNDDSVFIVLGGFGTSHVFATGNGGGSWTDIGVGLPDVPFNAILIDPVDPNVIYAGCDFGVFVSPDRGASWMDFNSGFWDATLVMDLQADASNRIVAATHGKGIFRTARYSAVVPGAMANFNGFNKGGNNILEWTAQQETQLVRVDLERSADGVNFNKISSYKIPATNNSSAEYQFADPVTDTKPVTWFYRARMITTSGASRFTRVIALEANKPAFIKVLSNPFRDQLVFNLNMTGDEQVAVKLYDSRGALVKAQQFTVNAGLHTLSLDQLQSLPAGVYTIEARTAKERFSGRLVKQ